MNRKIVLYGVGLGLMVVCLKVLQYKLVIVDDTADIYAGAVAVIFTVVGMAAGKRIHTRQAPVTALAATQQAAVTTFTPTEANTRVTDLVSLSKREHEILCLMAEGYSNQQIADAAFVSVSTVKTHVSNLFLKLDVERRTQAVKKAKELNLIA